MDNKGRPQKQQKDHAVDQSKNSGFSAPSIQLPKGGGAIRSMDEKFSVNSVNGTAGFSIPVPVADARGFSPSLSLSYNSGGGNGIFGLGWTIGLAAIRRKTEKELPRYGDAIDTDTYVLSQAEDLVPVIHKELGKWKKEERDSDDGLYRIRFYRPRIEGGFARIERWSAKADGIIHWRVITRENLTTIYGFNSSARLSDPSDPKKTFEWLIEFSYDDKGHAMLYEYKPEDHVGLAAHELHERNRFNGIAPYTNTYLKRVRYGNVHPYLHHNDPFPTEFIFENVFDYGELDPVNPPFNEVAPWEYRADAFSDYRSGFEIRTSRLCRRILLYHRFAEYNAPVKTVSFNYDDNGQQGFRFLRSAVITGYTKQDDGTFTQKSIPPFSFEYQKHEWNKEIKNISRDALVHAPAGIDEPNYQWIDLFGEGLSGLLTEQGDTWYYKHNLGQGNFTHAHRVDPRPSFKGLGKNVKLVDLEGNTLKDLVQDHDSPKGFFELDENNEWQPFHAFETYHNTNAGASNAKMLDLDGDGRADLLIAEDEVFTWYPSKGKQGYASAQRVRRVTDEEKGPYIVFADGTQTIFISDMSGDGLSDIVRIRNGELCYWPNLGFGRFGAKVSMSNAPTFDSPDLFNPSLIRLADIDGSGTTDVIYLGGSGFRVWMNQHGNSFLPAPVTIDPFPEINASTQITILDLLGTGTSCIVWNNALPKDVNQPLRYIDLMNSRKPHVMVSYKNNMGKEMQIEYTPSTRFYIDDKLAGKPWVTRLPFPVQCVSKVVSIDRILKLRFATTYSYHHGYYDIEEREFRGFGRVEQIDSETVDHFVKNSGGMMNNIVEKDLHQDPVKVISWFHTGAWKGNDRILNQFAHEYFQNQVVPEHHLPDPELGQDMGAQEYREALRACKGTLLRKEAYALDNTNEQTIPYLVEDHNLMIRMLQEVGNNKYAVFYPHESEAVTYHYERNLEDARVGHSFVLEIDYAWGLVKRSANVGYPRRPPAMGMPPHPAEQTQLLIAYSEHAHTPAIETPAVYRGPAEYTSKSFEVVGILPGPTGYFERIAFAAACNGAVAVDYHEVPAPGQKRLSSFSRTQFCDDDTITPLAFGIQDTKGLIYKNYQAALNRPMLDLFKTKITAIDLENLLTDPLKGGYVFADNYFWVPSGTMNYDASHFYQSTEFTDPFGKKSVITYDTAYRLFVKETEDALQNKTKILKMNWRVMSPLVVEDLNGNHAAVRFDELGMVIRGFVLGKPGTDKADVFDDSVMEMSLLDQPTVMLDYSLFEWNDQAAAPGFNPEVWYKPRPNYVRTRARETHYNADAMHLTQWQESYSYSDGGGHEVLKKVQAEPGPALQVNADGSVTQVPLANPRWVGNGRTILNNKGNPVKSYESYFSVSKDFDDEKEMVELGFPSITHYDTINRPVRIDHANGTFTSVTFTPWIEFDFDENDNVCKNDCKWYSDRGSPNPLGAEPNDPEERAAWLAAKHFDTPTAKYADSLGRTWLTIADNAADGKYKHRIVIDIEGHEKMVYDALDRLVAQYDNDMVGHKVKQQSMDAGERWLLSDVLSKPLITWDDRGHTFTHDFDELHRPVASYVTDAGITKMVDRTVYGENAPAAADPVGNNLKGTIYKHYDQSGITTHISYNFKGGLTSETQQFTEKYDVVIDWTNIAAVSVLPDIFESGTEYDALSRPVKITSPHTAIIPASEILPKYNASNLLDSIDVNLRGDSIIHYVENVNYNAKGRRTEVFFGNGTKTKYTIDPITDHLTDILTTKNAGAVKLQDIHYTFDAVGNITEVTDASQDVKFFSGEEVKPVNKYVYDAVYRLLFASGRKHAGQNVVNHHPADFNYRNHPFSINTTPPPSPNDANAFCKYSEEYTYDHASNMTEQKHKSNFNAFTRTFEYDFGANTNNHLTKTEVGAFSFVYGAYDPHGNMSKMEHLSELFWGSKDELRMADLGGGGKAWYVYDSGGKRMRKVIERKDGTRKERLYMGVFEVYREYDAGGVEQLRRESLSVMDGTQRVALAETKTKDGGVDIANPEPLHRYQYSNNLDSATIELDDLAKVISYEEYFPYGTTSFSTIDDTREVPEKRYRYTKKERDGETGLTYHGARYYAPWLCRWTSADPLHTADGNNIFIYCHCNPIAHSDPTGTLSWGQWAGIGAAVVIGTIVTVATAGAAGPIVGTVAAGIIGGIVGGAAGGAVAEVVEARIDHREAHVGRAALTGAVVGGVFAGGGALVGAAVRSAAAKAVGTAVAKTFVGTGAKALGTAVGSLGKSVSQSAVGRAVSGAASRVGGSVVGRGAAGLAKGVSSGLQAIERGAAKAGQRVASAVSKRGAAPIYGQLPGKQYPGVTYFEPKGTGTRAANAAEERVLRSPFNSTPAELKEFAEGANKLGFKPTIKGAEDLAGMRGAGTSDIGRGMGPRSSVDPVTKQVEIISTENAPAHVGVLTDEYLHMWNEVSGRGSSLTGEAAYWHVGLDADVKALGGTAKLGEELNYAFHKLEMLNFLESGVKMPGFMTRAGTREELKAWAQSFVEHL